MPNPKLYNAAKAYLDVIERMERTTDRQKLVDLEEQRVVLHNRLIQILKRDGIPFKDRDHVTRLAWHLVRGGE